jgi:AcrR family transcriptional regulator
VTKSELTPNHQARRSQLVQAAQRVLERDGIKGCSSRAIAAESGLNNGLIHYYYKTVGAIVDAAMRDFGEQIVARIEAAAARHDDPTERFWAVIDEHLAALSTPPGRTVLWMDYWVAAQRSGRSEAVGRIDDVIAGAIEDALRDAGVPDPHPRARAISNYVMGTAISGQSRPQTHAELHTQILTMSSGLALPARA